MRLVFDTAWGEMGAEGDGGAITGFFLPGCLPDNFESDEHPSELLQRVRLEVGEYLDRRRRRFTIPVKPSGTPFQLAVWSALGNIAFGALKTYGDVAAAVGSPDASRAVGMACGRNPVPLLIPCHRVVGTGNRLTGFSGGGIDMKRRLIELEMGGLFARREA